MRDQLRFAMEILRIDVGKVEFTAIIIISISMKSFLSCELVTNISLQRYLMLKLLLFKGCHRHPNALWFEAAVTGMMSFFLVTNVTLN